MNIPETIEYANSKYRTSLDAPELSSALDMLKAVIDGKMAIEENQTNAEGLYYRLNAKILALKYFDGGYLEEDYQNLIDTLQNGLVEIDDKPFPKTKVLYQSLIEVAGFIRNITADVYSLISTVQGEDGECVTSETEKLEYLLNIFNAKVENVTEGLADTSTLFPSSVNMFDVKTRALEDLGGITNWLSAQIERLSEKDVNAFLQSNLTEFSVQFPLLAYYQNLPNTQGAVAKAYVVQSPIVEEVEFFITALSNRLAIKFYKINLNAFNDKTKEFIDAVLDELKSQATNLVIYGAKGYFDNNKEYLLSKLIAHSKESGYVFAIDYSGEKTLYDEFVSASKTLEGISVLDISILYLRMPAFSTVTSAFIDKTMITQADGGEVKRQMAYLGYAGLNKCVHLFISGKAWKDTAIRISSVNGAKITEYLRNIPSQDQFIGRDWIDLALEEKNVSARGEFDYDLIRVSNPKNVKMILESDLALFAKCGLITRYCTLCGDDYSRWKTLSLEERTNRMNEATKLVCYLLECQYVPEVEIILQKDWTREGAGGVCMSGGKKIIYRDDCTLDYDWAVKAVCHECYHAFQQTVIDLGYKKWHFTSLGVTAPRPIEWHENNQNYVDVAKNREGYLRQVLEADARIFEEDCFNQSENKWHLFNLE